MRIAVGITVPGAALLIAGLLAGSAGEVIRLGAHRGWQSLANAATVLVTGAMVCGVMLLAVVGWWWGQAWRRRRYPGRDLASGPAWPPARPLAGRSGRTGGPAGRAAPPLASRVPAGDPGNGTVDAGMAGTGPPGAGPPGPGPSGMGPPGAGPPGPGPSGMGSPGAGPPGPGPSGMGPSGTGPAEQKLVELRDLYHAAGEMSDAALGESWDELTRRQEELIRGYFEASKASRDGQPGGRRRLPRLPGRSSR